METARFPMLRPTRRLEAERLLAVTSSPRSRLAVGCIGCCWSCRPRRVPPLDSLSSSRAQHHRLDGERVQVSCRRSIGWSPALIDLCGSVLRFRYENRLACVRVLTRRGQPQLPRASVPATNRPVHRGPCEPGRASACQRAERASPQATILANIRSRCTQQIAKTVIHATPLRSSRPWRLESLH